jgi:hypothetical protein
MEQQAKANAHQYRATRIFLTVVSIMMAVGGVVMVFSTKGLVRRAVMSPPPGEVSTLMLFVTKEFGGVLLMLAAMMWFASRDPVRNVAILDAFIFGFCVLAITPLITRAMLPIRDVYPESFIWARSISRVIMAGVFYWIRPKRRNVKLPNTAG